MSAPKEILELVERFERNLDAYRSGQYNETQLRREFLDPFFKALGWDIDNEQGYAEAYKDVIHEDAIQVGEGTKAPDYCFRIGGARKFFLEAKKPAVDIKHDVSPAFQLRRYGFTTSLPLNILSDFEGFAVYDCRFKPDQHDNAARARILYVPYTEYATRWEEIANVFSRDAVLKGAFHKFAESTKAKRGTAEMDDEFLKTIEGWRAELARNLALRNPKLTQRELNFAVQRIIDRVIFLRICEGRGIEDYGRLQALTNGDRIYRRLAQQFEQADDRYNSGLFHFKSEKGRHEAPDELTLCESENEKGGEGESGKGDAAFDLPPAHSPAFPPSANPRVVARILDRGSKLRSLDPTCGSGSFLIAYQYLLDWHRDFDTDTNPEKRVKVSKPIPHQTTTSGRSEAA